MKNVIGFFVNQIDEFRYSKKPPKLKPFDKVQKDDDDIEIFKHDFLNENEFEEIKNVYSDFGMGDLVLVFPNPDAEGVANKAINFKTALNIYEDMLNV